MTTGATERLLNLPLLIPKRVGSSRNAIGGHRSIEFRKFLDTIDDSVPTELDVHLIMDRVGRI
jgi:hypothetical protein